MKVDMSLNKETIPKTRMNLTNILTYTLLSKCA